MSRLSDALKQARDQQTTVGPTTGSIPRDVVVASDESIVVAPWTFDRADDLPVADLPVPSGTWADDISIDAAPTHARRRVVVSIVLLAAAVAGASWLVVQRNGAGGAGAFEVKRGALRQIVAARGKVEPGAEIGVTAKMIGRIKALHVREGHLVRQGQLLAEMDDDDLRAQLEQAAAVLNESRARLAEALAGARPQERETAQAKLDEARSVGEEARASLERQRRLAADGLIPKAQLDEAELKERVAAAQLRTAQEQASLVEAGTREEARAIAQAQVARAEAEVRHAQALLANAQVVSPVAGRVLRVYMHPGEVIVLQRPQPIVLLGEGRNVFVRAEVDESDLNKVQLGQSAIIRSDAYPDRTFTGRVVEIAPAVGRKMLRSDDPAEMLDTKVLETRIELPADATPALGLTVDVEILVVEKPDATIVPARAVLWDEGTARVEVRVRDRSETRRITTGVRDDEFVEVLDGLGLGETVVVKPQGVR